MLFSESITKCFKKYFDITGRASRAEYWYFYLFLFIIFSVLFAVEFCIYWFTLINIKILITIYIIIDGLFFLTTICPFISVSIRRLHDTDRNGAYILLNVILIIGNIIYLISLCKDSDFGENHYGPNPKGLYRTSDGRVLHEDSKIEEIEYHPPWKD